MLNCKICLILPVYEKMKEETRKVTDHLNEAKKTLISFEIIPPKRGGDIEDILKIVSRLKKYKPAFIDVTSHAAEIEYIETDNTIRKVIMRKRPGTLVVGAIIQRTPQFGMDTVLHVLCRGFTKEETEDFLIETNYARIKNILAVRGDSQRHKISTLGRTVNNYALDLVKQITDMNNGKHLNNPHAKKTDFCIGVAGYPEVHFEAPNIETDIKHLKRKIDAGAEYIVSQMFFDNNKYFRFVDKCRAEGINVPIIPGIKILTLKSHLISLPKNFHIGIPYELSNEVEKASQPEHVEAIGVEWAARQVEELISRNVPAIHFFIMQNDEAIHQIMKKIGF